MLTRTWGMMTIFPVRVVVIIVRGLLIAFLTVLRISVGIDMRGLRSA